MQHYLFEWLTPQGVIAIGVLWGLLQQFIQSRRTARAVTVLAETTEKAHAMAAMTSKQVSAVAATIEEVKLQTNGMSHRLEALAGEAGEARGLARAEAESKKP